MKKMIQLKTLLAATGLMFVFSANAYAQIQVGPRSGNRVRLAPAATTASAGATRS
jgi:hypothetical protein